MFEKIKLSLRISNNALDGEIPEVIDMCKRDLQRVHIVNLNDDDPLIVLAVILYAKAFYDFANKGEFFQKRYDLLKCSLSADGEYNGKLE